ncbi:unnamed protein product [Closterium sp. NIES-64]|nr:unnamed protein product [Closterium sp. NIES-64]
MHIDWDERIAAMSGEKRGGGVRGTADAAAAAPAIGSEASAAAAEEKLKLLLSPLTEDMPEVNLSSMTDKAEGEVAFAIIEEGFAVAGAFNIADYVPLLSYLDPQRMYARAQRLAPQLHGFMRACIEERRRIVLKKGCSSNEGDETALIDVLFEIEGEGEDEMDKDDMLMLAVDMMMAGSDTTSKTVEWALAELAQHPDMLERLRTEVDEAYARFLDPAAPDVTGQNFSLLPFGSGRRGCLGTNLGLDLSARLLANFVLRFDFKLPEDARAAGGVDMTETFGLTMALARPLRIVARERKAVAGVVVAASGA